MKRGDGIEREKVRARNCIRIVLKDILIRFLNVGIEKVDVHCTRSSDTDVHGISI